MQMILKGLIHHTLFPIVIFCILPYVHFTKSLFNEYCQHRILQFVEGNCLRK
jgi:hypothetical protein